MGDYHKYLYDLDNNRIVGDYESAYASCDDVHPSQHEIDTAKHYIIEGHLTRLPPQAPVLDVGCGYGDFVERLRKYGINICGCDVSPTAIDKGKERFPECDLRVGDIRQGLPYEANSFSATLLLGVVWFLLDNLDYCFEEASRVLQPNGLLFCSLGFPKNQQLGKNKLPDAEHLRCAISKHFAVEDVLTVSNSNQIRNGTPIAKCDEDVLVVGRKV